MPNVRLTIPVTPPGTMGTTKGGHIYVEMPDQSTDPTARMDGVTIMDGSFVMQDDWAPIDLGKIPYAAAEQPWVIDFGSGLNPRIAHSVRVYVSSYSDDVDTPLVRAGQPGATPSVVVTLPAVVVAKPASGSNVTHDLVTGISASVGTAVSVSGKLKRPISVTVDLSGLAAGVSPRWGYQLLGFVNGDLTTDAVLATGIITDVAGGLIPAGPDGIDTPHTFGPEEPTALTSITIYAVSGEIASDRYTPGTVHRTPGAFVPNNIVPGITASCVVSIGSTTGVSDPTAFIQSLLASVFGTVGGFFDITPLAIDTARIALLAVDTAQLAALSATAAKLATGAVTTGKLAALAVDAAALATSAVTSTKIASAAVGTAAIANAAITSALIGSAAVGTAAIATAAITTALIANAAVGTAQIANLAVGTAQIASLAVGTAQIASLAVGTAQIANLAVTNAKINDLDVSKLNAGTISVAVSLTSPTISITSGTLTINLDATNQFKLTDTGLGQFATVRASAHRVESVSNSSWFGQLGLASLILQDNSGNRTSIGGSFISCSALPSSSPGSGTKQFWYDPADGNRVKFAA